MTEPLDARPPAQSSPSEPSQADVPREEEDAGEVLRDLVAWNERYPPDRIYGAGSMPKITGELTAIVERAAAALRARTQEQARCASRLDDIRCSYPAGHDGLHHDSMAFWGDEDADALRSPRETEERDER